MKKFASILGIIVSLVLIWVSVSILIDGVPAIVYSNGGYDLERLNYNGSTAPSVSNGTFSGLTMSSTSFGADFYTYSYKATRAAANNVEALGEYLEKTGGSMLRMAEVGVRNGYILGGLIDDLGSSALGIGVGVAGLFGLLLSLFGLGCCGADKKRLALLQEIANGLNRSSQKEQELLRQIAEKRLEVVIPAAREEN